MPRTLPFRRQLSRQWLISVLSLRTKTAALLPLFEVRLPSKLIWLRDRFAVACRWQKPTTKLLVLLVLLEREEQELLPRLVLVLVLVLPLLELQRRIRPFHNQCCCHKSCNQCCSQCCSQCCNQCRNQCCNRRSLKLERCIACNCHRLKQERYMCCMSCMSCCGGACGISARGTSGLCTSALGSSCFGQLQRCWRAALQPTRTGFQDVASFFSFINQQLPQSLMAAVLANLPKKHFQVAKTSSNSATPYLSRQESVKQPAQFFTVEMAKSSGPQDLRGYAALLRLDLHRQLLSLLRSKPQIPASGNNGAPVWPVSRGQSQF